MCLSQDVDDIVFSLCFSVYQRDVPSANRPLRLLCVVIMGRANHTGDADHRLVFRTEHRHVPTKDCHDHFEGRVAQPAEEDWLKVLRVVQAPLPRPMAILEHLLRVVEKSEHFVMGGWVRRHRQK